MPVILGGDLRYFGVAELLSMFAAHAHSGTLSASDGSRKVTVCFREGRVSWADSDGDHLGAEEEVLDLLSWRDGTFEFVEDSSLPAGRQSLDLEIQPLLSEGLRRESEKQKILSFYPDDSITFTVADDPSTDGKVSMTAEQFKLVFQIGRGRSLRELCEQLGRPPLELYPIIHELQANGWIIPVSGSNQGTPAAPPKSAAKSAAKESRPQPAPAAVRPAATPQPPPKAQDSKPPSAAPGTPAPSPTRSADGKSAGERPAPSTPVPSPAPAPVSLIGSLTVDGPSGAVYPLLEDECGVGRASSNVVTLTDGSISGKHARILRTPEGFVVEDLKSRNGTFVNGEQVKERHPLADKDVVRFGKVLLTFHLANEMAIGEQTAR